MVGATFRANVIPTVKSKFKMKLIFGMTDACNSFIVWFVCRNTISSEWNGLNYFEKYLVIN